MSEGLVLATTCVEDIAAFCREVPGGHLGGPQGDKKKGTAEEGCELPPRLLQFIRSQVVPLLPAGTTFTEALEGGLIMARLHRMEKGCVFLPHFDHRTLYALRGKEGVQASAIVTVTLCGEAEFSLWEGKKLRSAHQLRKGSVCVISGRARSDWKHSVTAKSDRDVLILREVNPSRVRKKRK